MRALEIKLIKIQCHLKYNLTDCFPLHDESIERLCMMQQPQPPWKKFLELRHVFLTHVGKDRVTEHMHDKLQQPWFGKNAYIHVILPQHFNLRVLDVGSQFLQGICLHLPYPIADQIFRISERSDQERKHNFSSNFSTFINRSHNKFIDYLRIFPCNKLCLPTHIQHEILFSNALGNRQSPQKHLKTIDYAKLGWGRKQSASWGVRKYRIEDLRSMIKITRSSFLYKYIF